MIIGALLTIGYAVQGLPSITERNYANFKGLPLFFGTALFAFEGIALILPLQNAMKKPQSFTKIFGVLNVGMVLVTIIYLLLGTIGYWRYGENSAASLTLNLPADQM
jgi:solute carrier family 36 (proton-coupled amino acid transporter)